MTRPFRALVVSLALALALGPALRAAQAIENGFFSGGTRSQSPTAAPADPTMADLEASENALVNLWTRLPYATRHVMFLSRKAQVYGDYDQRPTNVFAPGEKLVTYMEPVGYAWKTLGAGLYGFGVTIDFEILTRGGKVLGGQRAFQNVDLTSHYQNREFFVTATLSIDGLDAGDYVIAYTLRDNVNGRTTRVEQPFTIKAAS